MPRPRFIVCESTNRWTVAMRWGLSGSKVRVHQTISLDGCRAMLADAAGSVVALEVAMFGVEPALRAIRDLRETFPGSPVIALADSGCPYEAILREAGAAHVVASRREIPAAARFVRRCLNYAEVQPESYRERVWSRMPWGNHTALQPAFE